MINISDKYYIIFPYKMFQIDFKWQTEQNHVAQKNMNK